MKLELLLIYLHVFCSQHFTAFDADDAVNQPQVTFLEPGTVVDYQPKKPSRLFFNNDMRIYCYRGFSKELSHFFESIELQLEIERDEFTQYEGATANEVLQHFKDHQSIFSFNLFTYKRTRLHLSPFRQQCIGIDTELPYRVHLQQTRVDCIRLLQFGLGISVFLLAGKLSHNSIFYYLTGVVLGVCLSFMLIVWLFSKLMPRRPIMYGMIIGGWTLGLYIIRHLWENVHLIFQMYRTYVIWYILVTALLSFLVCYRIGPPKNQRSKNVVKWVLQIIAITLIYYSSQYDEASATIGLITVVVGYFPFHILRKLRNIYRRFFPKQRRLLTSEEYQEQGVIETAKALNELRAYASSPDCKQWKLISKLRDPLRFASFVEGDSHLQEEEIESFESFRAENESDETDYSEDEDERLMDNDLSMNNRYPQYTNDLKPFRNSRYAIDDEMDDGEYENGHFTSAETTKKAPNGFSKYNANNSTYTRVNRVYSPDSGYMYDRNKSAKESFQSLSYSNHKY